MNETTDLKRKGYVQVVVDVPALGDRQFTYSVPDGFRLPFGSKVYVPFGRTKADGYVVSNTDVKPDYEVKDILSVYDTEYLPPKSLLAFSNVLKDYYFATTASFWSYLWPPLVPKRTTAQVTNTSLFDRERNYDLPKKTGLFGPRPIQFVEGSFSFRWKVYLDAISKAFDQGFGIIVLVPEIRRIAEIGQTLEPMFGKSISYIHSEMTGASRRRGWFSLLKGETSISLGTRSSVFSPVKNLGLIVVDEEESSFYKAEEYPRYNAATVAKLRAEYENCRVIKGSFVPSVNTKYMLMKEDFEHIKERQEDCGLNINTQAISLLGRSRRLLITKELHLSLKETFDRKERALLFLNRRGTSPSLVCTDCGNAVLCPRCSVSLAYHSKERELVCHTCGHRQSPPSECPLCKGYTLKASGFGIDRAASEFKKRFPNIPVLVLDSDAASPSHIIEEFEALQPSCLLSTQMVLGFPKIPAIGALGILTCDSLLNLPDYKASEEVFRLLMSLVHLLKTSGGSLNKTFVIQSLNPEHYAIKSAKAPESFYDAELDRRKDLKYPPFGAVFKLEFSGRDNTRSKTVSERFAESIEECSEGITVLGPSPAPKAKVRGQYRWHIILKASDRELLGSGVSCALRAIERDSKVRITVDSEEPFSI